MRAQRLRSPSYWPQILLRLFYAYILIVAFVPEARALVAFSLCCWGPYWLHVNIILLLLASSSAIRVTCRPCIFSVCAIAVLKVCNISGVWLNFCCGWSLGQITLAAHRPCPGKARCLGLKVQLNQSQCDRRLHPDVGHILRNS